MNSLVTTVRNRQWLAMVHAQKESGLPINVWCRNNGISENCFYYRRQKLREIYGGHLPAFTEIKPPAAAPEPNPENLNSAASIQAGALTVSLSNNASEELIARIVRALNAG